MKHLFTRHLLSILVTIIELMHTAYYTQIYRNYNDNSQGKKKTKGKKLFNGNFVVCATKCNNNNKMKKIAPFDAEL